jgi:GNAT superfamily N-acetyltransferase
MSAVFRIRPYGDSDRLTVYEMMNALQEHERAIEANRAHWADRGAAYSDWTLQQVAENQGAVFVAEADDGAKLGFATCWRAGDETDITVVAEARQHLYVGDLFVSEAWRGRGVGGALLAEAERHGRAIGLSQMTIGVLAINAGARRAYAKAGFEEYEMLLRKRL